MAQFYVPTEEMNEGLIESQVIRRLHTPYVVD